MLVVGGIRYPIAPSLYNLSNKMDNSLLAVKDINHKHIVVGGTLVFGCRSVYKDMTGKCVMDLLPGCLTVE